MKNNISTILLSATCSLAVASGACAQQDFQFDEIFVSAQKREESVQDVPISIQVLSQDFILKEDLRSLRDYVDLIPSIAFEPSLAAGGSGGLSIRGIGALGGVSRTWALYVDGFDMTGASTSGAAARLADPERIEVLRGPQGTAFGRNVVAGAINITTQTPDPSSTFGTLALDAGNNGTYGAIGSVNLSLSDNSAVMVSGFYDTTDGYVDNIGPSGGSNDSTNYGGRIGYYADLTEQLSIKASIAYEENERGLRGAVPDGEIFPTTQFLIDNIIDAGFNPFLAPGTADSQLDVFFPAQNNTVSIDIAESSESDLFTGILNLTYDFGSISLVSVSGYSRREGSSISDSDSSEFDSIFSTLNSSSEFLSTELRLQSNGDNRLDWVGGVFASSSESKTSFQVIASELLRASTFIPGVPASAVLLLGDDASFFPDNNLFIVNAPPGTIYEGSDTVLEGQAYAIFGDINFELTDRLALLAGARYNYDEFEQTVQNLIDPNPLPEVNLPGIGQIFLPFSFEDANDTVDSDAVTWRVSAVYDIIDSVTAYTTVSTGYRPGGLQLQNTQLTRNPTTQAIELDTSGFFFDPERITNYEIGLKGFLFNRTLNFSTAAFFMDWEDVQFLTIDEFSGASVTGNAGAEAYGAELEVQARPNPYLSLSGALSYIETEVTEIGNDANDPRLGQPLPDAPNWSATATIDYQRPVFGAIEAFARATFKYEGERNDRLEPPGDPNQFVLESYQVLDIRFGFEKPNFWRLEGYIDNATDEIYATTVFNNAFSLNGTQFVTPAGRTYGARLVYSFR